MKKHILLLTMALLILMIAMPVQANTITLANPDGTGNRDVLVYYANGTFYGLYNMTSVITTDTTNASYIFTFKPQGNSIIDDPADWLGNYAFPYVRSNFLPLALILGCMGIFLAGLRGRI